MTTNALADTLAIVAQRAQMYQARGITLYEANTIDTIITPVLRALDWDIEDIDQVKREYRHHPKDNPVDFALLQEGSPVLYVEAKGIMESLDDRKWITQTHAYAHSSGVQWAVLTNGVEWRIYKVSALGQAEEKMLLRVRIDDTNAAEALDVLARQNLVPRCKLDSLWRTKEIDGVMKHLFSNMADHPGILKAFAKATDGKLTTEEVRQALRRAKPRADWGQVGTPFEPTGPTRDNAPSHLAQNHHTTKMPTETGTAQTPPHAPTETNTGLAASQADRAFYPTVHNTESDQASGRRGFTFKPKMQHLLDAGILRPGQTLRLRHKPQETCSVVDGKLCSYKGATMTYNAWGCLATGWTAIQIYMHAETEEGVLLDNLRANLSVP